MDKKTARLLCAMLSASLFNVPIFAQPFQRVPYLVIGGPKDGVRFQTRLTLLSHRRPIDQGRAIPVRVNLFDASGAPVSALFNEEGPVSAFEAGIGDSLTITRSADRRPTRRSSTSACDGEAVRGQTYQKASLCLPTASTSCDQGARPKDRCPGAVRTFDLARREERIGAPSAGRTVRAAARPRVPSRLPTSAYARGSVRPGPQPRRTG